MQNLDVPSSSSALVKAYLRANIGDVFGGLAAMLVALPSAIAFGLLVFSPLGGTLAASGAIAGILGTVAMGLIAPVLGGTPRLISAPCAPAAAVLAALGTELIKGPLGTRPELIALTITFVALLSGTLQFIFGSLGGGRLIKYIPYPVVAGYLSGVGVLIFIGQVPKLLGLPKVGDQFSAILNPGVWNIPALSVGCCTILVMVLAPKFTRAIPAPIIALGGGILAYFGFSFVYPELGTVIGNPLVIGPIGGQGATQDVLTGAGGVSVLQSIYARWSSIPDLNVLFGPENLRMIFVPGLTLAVLLSIDTLKTCVVLDALTRSRHNSNRELIGQGLANLSSAFVGGLPGAGTMGATLLNLSSGGQGRASGIFSGVFALLAFLLLGNLVAWVPVSALAGILIVVAFRMVDRNTLKLLGQKSTVLDFLVVAAVVFTAVLFNLIAAAGVGLALAIFLFVRDQVRGSVVRRRVFGNQVFSKKRRLPTEAAVLEVKGAQTAIFELQGSLFFGTTDQLFNELEPHLAKSRYIVLDMRRIHSVDFTAAHMLEQIEAQIAERDGVLIFTGLPANLPTGKDLHAYFDQVGLVRPTRKVKIFPTLDHALEWTEEQILSGELFLAGGDDLPLALHEIDLFRGLPPEALAKLAPSVPERTVPPQEKVFSQGDTGDELFLIRNGTARIELPLGGGKTHHLATFAKGDFFGDMSFLDQGTRSANAVALTELKLFVLSRAKFDRLAADDPALGGMVFSRLAFTLAIRLRQTDIEVRALEEA